MLVASLVRCISAHARDARCTRLRSLMLVVQWVMPTAAQTECNVKVVAQASKTTCVRGQNFDCYPGGRTMWTARGCRGQFRCSGSVIGCGRYYNKISRSQPLFNCTCISDTLPDAWSYTWATNEETVALLQGFATMDSHTDDKQQWLGAIISVKPNGDRYRTAAAAVTSAGFVVEHIPAAMPSQYSGKKAMVQELFGRDSRSIMISMTPFEIALLIGHKRAARVIATSNYEWGAIFEDDVYLHEATSPMQAQHLLRAAFRAADAAPGRNLPPLLYLGSCQPLCDVELAAVDATSSLGAGLPQALLRTGRCQAYCTHAFALSRGRALTFFDDIFGCSNRSRTCGSDCDVWPCYMDWAMHRYFERSGEAWIVGGGLQGPFARSHRGLFIQNRSAALGNNVGRSGLAKRFKWSSMVNDSLTANDGFLEENACERNANASRPAHPLEKLFITIEWKGRLGNLMFETAMLAALKVQLKEIVHDTEVVTFGLPASVSVPAHELFQHFQMSQLVRQEREGNTGFDFGLKFGGCEACALRVRERFANAYDEPLLKKLKSWATSPPPGCRFGRIKLEGFFQSFRYFHGVADNMLRSNIFRASSAVQREADDYLRSIRRQLTANHPRGVRIVGVQVRLGDKSADGLFSGLYARTSWDYYRVAMDSLRHVLIGQGAENVAFVVTAGGTLGSNAVDIADARGNLSLGPERQHKMFFSTAESPYFDLALLRSCDALVVGPSSFGWWSAYLAELPVGHVVVPRHIINPFLPPDHYLIQGFKKDDYYPPGWRVLENDGHMTRQFLIARQTQT